MAANECYDSVGINAKNRFPLECVSKNAKQIRAIYLQFSTSDEIGNNFTQFAMLHIPNISLSAQISNTYIYLSALNSLSLKTQHEAIT